MADLPKTDGLDPICQHAIELIAVADAGMQKAAAIVSARDADDAAVKSQIRGVAEKLASSGLVTGPLDNVITELNKVAATRTGLLTTVERLAAKFAQEKARLSLPPALGAADSNGKSADARKQAGTLEPRVRGRRDSNTGFDDFAAKVMGMGAG